MLEALLAILTVSLQAAPQEEPGFWRRDTILGDLGGVRPSLAERGITFTLAFTGEVVSSVSGGLSRDTGADLLMDWMIDVDLSKAYTNEFIK